MLTKHESTILNKLINELQDANVSFNSLTSAYGHGTRNIKYQELVKHREQIANAVSNLENYIKAITNDNV